MPDMMNFTMYARLGFRIRNHLMPDFNIKGPQIEFQIGVLYLNLSNEEAKYPYKRGHYLYRYAKAQLHK